MVCGAATQRRERFYQKAKNDRYNTRVSSHGGAFGLIFTWLFDYASGKMYQEISVDIPVCEECKRQRREVRLKHLDFDRQVATFIVHSQFKAAINASSPVDT